jgi:hypothetical protein
MPSFTVTCPCCDAKLQVDSDLQAVLTFEEPPARREMADIETAVEHFKGEKARRDDAFQKSVEAERNKKSLLDRKFEELLKQAKDSPADEPPKRPFGLD